MLARVTWKRATLQSKQERLVAESSGGSNNQSESNDPAKEKPTDETIKVKITDISYNFVKKDGVVNAYTEIKGITKGVDHVSLCYVIYYKDGTYDVQ